MMNKWYPNYGAEKNEEISRLDNRNSTQQIKETALDLLTDVMRPDLAEMDPQERRAFCADMAADYSRLYGNETGRFFNAIAGARGTAETDETALGRRIMEKRNPHYRPTGN